WPAVGADLVDERRDLRQADVVAGAVVVLGVAGVVPVEDVAVQVGRLHDGDRVVAVLAVTVALPVTLALAVALAVAVAVILARPLPLAFALAVGVDAAVGFRSGVAGDYDVSVRGARGGVPR